MIKYFINDEEVTQDYFNEKLEDVIRDNIDIDDLLDDCYGTIKIGYGEYYASTILKELDPIYYGMIEDEEVSNKLSDLLSDFENENWEKIDGYYFETKEIEEDEE